MTVAPSVPGNRRLPSSLSRCMAHSSVLRFLDSEQLVCDRGDAVADHVTVSPFLAESDLSSPLLRLSSAIDVDVVQEGVGKYQYLGVVGGLGRRGDRRKVQKLGG